MAATEYMRGYRKKRFGGETHHHEWQTFINKKRSIIGQQDVKKSRRLFSFHVRQWWNNLRLKDVTSGPHTSGIEKHNLWAWIPLHKWKSMGKSKTWPISDFLAFGWKRIPWNPHFMCSRGFLLISYKHKWVFRLYNCWLIMIINSRS